MVDLMTSQAMRLKKAHVSMMKHPSTSLYTGIMLMGKSDVVDTDITAYTDGYNKKYGAKFISTLIDAELRALVLHENLHVALMHLIRYKGEARKNPKLMNMAMDYAVNDIITQVNDTAHLILPHGALHSLKYRGWSVTEIYNDLKKKDEEQPKQPKPVDSGSGEGETGNKPDDNGSLDIHDYTKVDELGAEEAKKVSNKIDRALREGGLLAGRMGSTVPRCIEQLLEPKVDWRVALRDFVSSAIRGKDEISWRKYNKRLIVNDIFYPSQESETVGELVVAIDTSGSISSIEMTKFASELSSICNTCEPERVRVLWWDTLVHAEQVFEPSQYGALASLLNPVGGGGTRVSSVSEYLVKNKVAVDAVIVLTDGYVESNVKWEVHTPTLWLVTDNHSFKAPAGVIVTMKED